MLYCVKCGKAIKDGILCQECTPEAGTCIHCGAQLRPGVEFCTSCGKKQGKLTIKPDYCNKCGTKLGEEDQFCPECGEKMKNVIMWYNQIVSSMVVGTYDENSSGTASKKIPKWCIVTLLCILTVFVPAGIIAGISVLKSDEKNSALDTYAPTTTVTTEATTTVYANNYDVEYLTGAIVQYDKEKEVYQIIFRLQDYNEQDIDAVGTANIKIVDNKYNVLYNREWDFDQADWTTITKTADNEEYYGCWLEIPRGELKEASGPLGTLSLNVSGTGFKFEQIDLDIYNLPSKINVVETKYNWNTDCNWTVSDLNYEIEYDKSEVNLKVTCVVTLNYLGWGISGPQRLYFGPRVIDSSNFVVQSSGYGSSNSLRAGEKSNVSFTIYGLAPSETYTIEFELND